MIQTSQLHDHCQMDYNNKCNQDVANYILTHPRCIMKQSKKKQEDHVNIWNGYGIDMAHVDVESHFRPNPNQIITNKYIHGQRTFSASPNMTSGSLTAKLKFKRNKLNIKHTKLSEIDMDSKYNEYDNDKQIPIQEFSRIGENTRLN